MNVLSLKILNYTMFILSVIKWRSVLFSVQKVDNVEHNSRGLPENRVKFNPTEGRHLRGCRIIK